MTAREPVGRVQTLDWQAIEGELNSVGAARVPNLLSPEECAAIADMYGETDGRPSITPTSSRFRSRVVMARGVVA